MDCSLPGSSVYGIFQARILEWITISFSRGSCRSRNRTQVFCIAGRLFADWAMKEALLLLPVIKIHTYIHTIQNLLGENNRGLCVCVCVCACACVCVCRYVHTHAHTCIWSCMHTCELTNKWLLKWYDLEGTTHTSTLNQHHCPKFHQYWVYHLSLKGQFFSTIPY